MEIEKVVQNIQRICKERGTTTTVACKESGAGKDMVSALKKQGTIPSVEKMSRLAAYLGVTTSELLGEKIGPTPVSKGEPDPELWEIIQRIPESRMPEVERYLRFQAESKEKP